MDVTVSGAPHLSINASGAPHVSVNAASGQLLTVSGLISIPLDPNVIALQDWVLTNFYSISNPAGYCCGSGGSGTGSFDTGILSGYVRTGQTGSFITTGQTGAFAPAAGTGNFITISQTGSFVTTGQTGTNTSKLVLATYNIVSGDGVSQFIQFAQNFASKPNVMGSLINNSGDVVIGHVISGISNSGFYIAFSEVISTNNYQFSYIAMGGSGLTTLLTV